MRNRSMRRWLGVAVAGLLTLTACAGQGTQQDDSGDGSGPVTLSFWNGFTGPDRAAVEGLVKQYNDSQDKVTVTSSSELINTQTATVAATLNADQLTRMPTPTRNALNAVTMTTKAKCSSCRSRL